MYSVILLAAMAAGDAAPAYHPAHAYGGWGFGAKASWGSCYGGCYGIGYTGWVGVGGWGHPHASTAGWGLPYGAGAGWGAGYGGYWPGSAGYGGCGGYAGFAYTGGGLAPHPLRGGVVPLPPGYEASRAAPPATAADAPARLVVQLPEGAKLYVDDSEIARPGVSRTFRTPALEKGQVYYYELRAEVEKDGKVLSQKRRVVVTAGKTVSADFRGLSEATSVAAKGR
jgi:uncharacterized protein (TIGR03000 family)